MSGQGKQIEIDRPGTLRSGLGERGEPSKAERDEPSKAERDKDDNRRSTEK